MAIGPDGRIPTIKVVNISSGGCGNVVAGITWKKMKMSGRCLHRIDCLRLTLPDLVELVTRARHPRLGIWKAMYGRRISYLSRRWRTNAIARSTRRGGYFLRLSSAAVQSKFLVPKARWDKRHLHCRHRYNRCWRLAGSRDRHDGAVRTEQRLKE